MALANVIPLDFEADTVSDGPALAAIMERRRSIRRLAGGPLGPDALDRILQTVARTPSAYNKPPWHVIVVRERSITFWDVVERAFRRQLTGDRLERYLRRLDGFRTGVATVLVYEDRAAVAEMRAACNLDAAQAQAYSEQALGMVQLSLWLAIVDEGLATSLQHWESLIEQPVARFLQLPADQYRLVATMPLGYPAEEARPVAQFDPYQALSLDRFARGGPVSINP